MLTFVKISGGIVLISALCLGLYLKHLDTRLKAPLIIEDKYWGPDISKSDDTSIRPFIINISDQDLQRFTNKLANTEPLEPPLEGIAFEYGTNTHYLESLVQYWKTSYDWRTREKFLNQFPQFKTQISGLDLHFIWIKPDKAALPQGTRVLPLLLMHGWPGSLREFYEFIPLLTKPTEGRDFAFEIVAPSLPGFGFSDGPSKPGLGTVQVSLVMKKLMERLGIDKYYIQGGDWGSEIGKKLSVLVPERVLGYHSNMCASLAEKSMLKLILATLLPSVFADTEREAEILRSQPKFWLAESGYALLQSTKPDTIGVALKDSPVGLAAYLLEKFSVGTNREWITKIDGGLDSYDKDALLDDVMIYWFSGSITTTMRMYRETYYPLDLMDKDYERYVHVPTACARFPNEAFYLPTTILKDIFKNLVKITDLPQGGHFAALEVPSLLADDFIDFISIVEEKGKQEAQAKRSEEPKIPLKTLKAPAEPEKTKPPRASPKQQVKSTKTSATGNAKQTEKVCCR